MADELGTIQTSAGRTDLYFLLRSGVQVVTNASGGALLADTDGNRPTAAIPASDTDHPLLYTGTQPAGLSAGIYSLVAYAASAGAVESAATVDLPVSGAAEHRVGTSAMLTVGGYTAPDNATISAGAASAAAAQTYAGTIAADYQQRGQAVTLPEGTAAGQIRLSAGYVSVSGGSTGLTAQEVRDAMKLAPTAGTASAGSIDAHLDSIQAKTDTIGALTLTVNAPVATDGSATIYQSDDYATADNRQIVFTFTGYTGPSLTSATTRMDLYGTPGLDRAVTTPNHTFAGTIAESSGTVTCSYALTAAQTALLAAKTWHYHIHATTASPALRRETLGTGTFTVK